MENIKRTLLITIICLIPFICYAVKMTDFTEDTSPTSDDLIWTTNNPSGTPSDRKVSLGNLLLWMATQDWTTTGTWDFSGDIEISKVNSAGGSADALTLSGTLGIMDGSDIFRGIYLNYTNADHTGSSNNIYGILINDITGDSEADEVALKIGLGWDYGIHTYSPIVIFGNGSTTPGYLYLEDADNSNYVTISAPADVTTTYTLTLPGAAPTIDGALRITGTDGTEAWLASVNGCTVSGTTDGVITCKDQDTFWASLESSVFSGSLTDEQLACFETTDGKNRLKSCGAKTTYTEPAGTLKAICSTGTNTTGACDPTAHPGGFSTIEIGHATDTTLGRTSAGVANIEGVDIALKPHTVQYAATPVIDDPDNFSTKFTGDNLYGGTFIANAAGTIALPNPAVGMNFTIVLEGANTVIIDPLGTGTADAIIMNGLAAAVDENITSSTSGAMCVFQYRSADRWMATCNGFVEATPP